MTGFVYLFCSSSAGLFVLFFLLGVAYALMAALFWMAYDDCKLPRQTASALFWPALVLSDFVTLIIRPRNHERG
ncbi:hypothetical protein [Spirosoma sordidisoli]|uniref:Uncharacterized protein n=1 Tax=Spirosoma sordidisoli TaxID=2502893 RepID=A0A4Q2UPV5_9BACT|nr:hypothetical protein [Spirosoma sordidisoli]RYC69650.1 hypothetical protein EQG79_13700 [Spirosoma sordidisoli]